MRQRRNKQPKKRNFIEESHEIDSMDRFIRENALESSFKINCKFKNKKQKEMYDTIMDNRITFVSGCAGTGKTLIALMAGLECIKNKNINISQIVLTKPIVEITTSRSGLGSLPGDVSDKISSHYTYFYDNLIKIIGSESTKHLKQNGIIKETVLNYLRGSTFGKYDGDGQPIGTFAMLDESQNCSIMEMLTFISRMGEESKLVILGDTDQSDLKLTNGTKNGLSDAIERLKGIEKIGFCEFTEDDIVRDPFLIEIIKRYKNK